MVVASDPADAASVRCPGKPPMGFVEWIRAAIGERGESPAWFDRD